MNRERSGIRRGTWTAAVVAAALLFAATARAGLEEADALRQEGKLAEAVAAYQEVLAGEPENVKALFGIGFCLTEIGKGEPYGDSLWAAREHLDRLVELAPEDPEVRYLNGYSASLLVYKATSSFTQMLQGLAIREFEAALATRPGHWESWFYLARVRRQVNDLQGAVDAFRKAIEIRPDRLDPYPELALTQYALKRYDDCIATARALREKAPGYHYTHKIIGDAETARPDFAAAEKEYLLGQDAEPLNALWADSLWPLIQASKDYAHGAEVFGAMAAKHEAAEAPRKWFALCLVALDRREEAAAQFRILAQSFGGNKWYWQWLGDAEERLGNDGAAVDAWLEALRINEDAAWSNPFIPLRARYENDKNAGRYAEAVALMRRVAAAEPPRDYHCWVQWEMSECLRQLGDVEGTVAALHKAMELDPLEPRFQNSLGLFYRTLKRFDEAIAQFLKALDVQAGYMYSLENLAATFQVAHRDGEAKQWLAKGLEEAQQQYGWAGGGSVHDLAGAELDFEVLNEREFDVFKFSYFLHEYETLEDAKAREDDPKQK